MSTERVDRLVSAFRNRFGRFPRWLAEAPGRVNLIGEHTDYGDGFVLPVAIDRTTLVAAAEAEGPESTVWSLDLHDESSFDVSCPVRAEQQPWSNYVRGAAWALAEGGYATVPVDLAISSEVPMGSGLSSSAALGVSVAAVFAAAAGADLRPVDLARLAHRSEVDFVGVPCGIMDQFISCLGVQDHALLIDCRSLDHHLVPLDLDGRGLALVVVDSGVSRTLAGSAYRERREQCGRALALLRPLVSRELRKLRDVTVGDLSRFGDSLPPLLLRRARHVVSENARVLACVDALGEQRWEDVGLLLAESHRSLRDDFEVSSPELDLLVELAWRTPGVVGSRLTGAGFGGCTVNLVEIDTLDRFRSRVLEEYRRATGKEPRLHLCRSAGGVTVASL